MLMRRVKRLRAARQHDLGHCHKCDRRAIVRLNSRGACSAHLDELVQQQAERAHAAFTRRIEQEVAR